MKIIISLLIASMLFVVNTLHAQKKVTITVTVVNATSDIGNVNFGLFDKTSFMKKPLQSSSSKIKKGKSVVTFKNVDKGEYAILCYHDKNTNDKMDFNKNGIPLEDFGASNNTMNYGPPNYEDAKFLVIDKNVSLDIKF